jgi:ubiquinone/menaquinone biosynthesis C-methylase UbiE
MTRPQHPSPWDRPDTVRGFATSTPNPVLVEFVRRELGRAPGATLLDLGCGAGRNAVPLAALGCRVAGIDVAAPMLDAAAQRPDTTPLAPRLRWLRATADALPFRDATFDLVVAHGVWNLARSGEEFRRAVRDAARVARPGAGLFVFTFSRNTLPDAARPVPGETFVFTEFSSEPQCFLTETQLLDELADAGFTRDPAGPLTEYNRPTRPLLAPAGPVIYEGTFRRVRTEPHP